MTVTSALTSTYEHKPPLEAPKNKANPPKRQNQRKLRLHKDLRKKPPLEPKKTKPNLKPNLKPAIYPPARTKQHLLCKTKPISQPLLMNLTSVLTRPYEHKPPLEAPKNKANSKPIGKKTATLAKLHQIRATSSEVCSSVPIRRLWPGFPHCRQPARTKQYLLCKAKPISQPLLMNLTSALTSTYDKKPPLAAPKNKANQTQFQTPRILICQGCCSALFSVVWNCCSIS